jgi:SAM-dependent methyltransferase
MRSGERWMDRAITPGSLTAMARLSERLRLRGGPRGESVRSLSDTGPPSAWVRGFRRELTPGALACEQQSVTGLLFDRLEADTVAEVEARMDAAPDIQAMGADMSKLFVRRPLVLHYGMWFEIPAVPEQSGLLPIQPPDEIHAMARGPLAAAGGLYESDLVIDSLVGAGVPIEELRSGLDFGCSSGRVIRVLAAAYPNVRWLACDPNERAVAWGRENLQGIDFSVSGDEPPLPYEARSLDLAFAISIWSHFEPGLGLRWFDEMHRLLRPGGHLVMTTHGLTSIGYYAVNGLRSPEQSQEIEDSLYRRGWWYAPEFGNRGDWGVVNPGWGTAFISVEWLLSHLCPRWRVVEFAPGRNALNQDVYVLERV